MNQQTLRVERPGAAWSALTHRPSSFVDGGNCKAVVSISWPNISSDGTVGAGSSQIELKAEPAHGVSSEEADWTCELESGWLDAIAAARSPELLLTASVDDSGAAKQLVLELAGLLTRRLQRVKPLIRVRFVPRPVERRASRRPRR